MSLVCILMPCYNAERFLAETLQSIRAQSHPLWELVAVDDGSTDQSAACISRFCPQARLLQGPHGGIGRALNLALPHARGRYLAFIDADDLWHPDKLNVQLQALNDHPEWDGCFVTVEQFWHDPQGRPAPPQITGRHRGALLVRNSSFERVGPFREDLALAEFIDWCARAEDCGLRLGLLELPYYRRRIHDQNTTLRPASDSKDFLKVLKATLNRRRSR